MTHISVYLPPFPSLLFVIIKRKLRILEKTSPGLLQNFLVLIIVLSFLDEVVEILIVIVKAQKAHCLKIAFFD